MEFLDIRLYNQYLEQYLEDRHLLFNHQPSGVEANKRDLNLFARFIHENNIIHVNGDAILEFITWLRKERKNKAGSINRKIASIRCYIKYLRFRQVTGANDLPVEYLSRAREPYPGPVSALTPEEVKNLLNSIDRDSVFGFRDYLVYHLMYRLGLRIGEAMRINLEDIDLNQGVLTVHGKGRRQRALPLLPDIGKEISTWLEIRKVFYNAGQEQALFISKKGNRLAIRTAQENFQKIVALAGPFSLKKVTPHSLRHAFATHAMEGDADLVVLKSIMGHASIESTQIYLHPSLNILRKAVNDHIASDILKEIIGGGKTILRIQQNYKQAA
jgi:site-specific recombinase XerD